VHLFPTQTLSSTLALLFSGSDYDRLHYSHLFNGPGEEAINLFTYASCIVNPLIYTFTLSRVRTGILLLLEQTKRRNTRESCGDGKRAVAFNDFRRGLVQSSALTAALLVHMLVLCIQCRSGIA